MSVDSARQLCTMFLSLHVVFLSVAIVESSAAANTSEEGKGSNARLSSPLVFMGCLCCRTHTVSLSLDTGYSFVVVVVVFIARITCLYLALMFLSSGGDTLRLCEIQRCGLQRGPAELLLGSVLSELDQHHQRL